MSDPANQVLADNFRSSTNFFESDRILRHYLQKHLDDAALNYMRDKINLLGRQAATEMDDLSLKADQQTPRLKKRTRYGEKLDEIEFHPAYWKLMDIAARSEMFYVKYESGLREKYSGNRQKMCFAAGQLYAMSELGVYCPLCMTDGAAHLVDRFAPDEIRERHLPKLSARIGEDLYTGAMFLTEKSGGSDVGANLSTAEQVEGNRYKLNGEKWFCSNVNAEIIMALARTSDLSEGSRGLSLFLVEKELPDGSRNPMEIVRLKEKLGVRSMATGEVLFNDTIGIRLGEEGEGFKRMAEMINISRLYNSVGAVACSRRAIVEVYQYLNHRKSFGRRIIEHALVRDKFQELGSIYLADFLLVWRAIQAMDAAESGENNEKELLRILIPMAKWRLAESSVYIVRECMELMGGNGYIEDFVMPKLLRDVNVLPIWEGSGNIIALDILRAAKKSKGLREIIRQIEHIAEESPEHASMLQNRLEAFQSVWASLQTVEDRDVVESTVKPLFSELIDLYQTALMIEELDDQSAEWLEQALGWKASSYDREVRIEHPAGTGAVHNLIAWDY